MKQPRRSRRVIRAPPSRDATSVHSAVRHLDDEGDAHPTRAQMVLHNKAVLDDFSNDKHVRRHGGLRARGDGGGGVRERGHVVLRARCG